MVSSILTPGTIFLMILGAINLAYPEVDLWVALLINIVPVAIMVLLCFKAKPDTQVQIMTGRQSVNKNVVVPNAGYKSVIK